MVTTVHSTELNLLIAQLGLLQIQSNGTLWKRKKSPGYCSVSLNCKCKDILSRGLL